VLETESSLIIDFLGQCVSCDRKFINSQNHHCMGVVPAVAEPGDAICIRYGCSVPIILRPKIGGVGKCRWSLVGIAMFMESWVAELSRQLISLQRNSSKLI
jgi:hypothetical protein